MEQADEPAGVLKKDSNRLPVMVADRQIEIVQLLANGNTLVEIAGQLGLSKKTVEAHMQNLKKKTGLKTLSQAVAHFLRHKLIK